VGIIVSHSIAAGWESLPRKELLPSEVDSVNCGWVAESEKFRGGRRERKTSTSNSRTHDLSSIGAWRHFLHLVLSNDLANGMPSV